VGNQVHVAAQSRAPFSVVENWTIFTSDPRADNSAIALVLVFASCALHPTDDYTPLDQVVIWCWGRVVTVVNADVSLVTQAEHAF
jgi:hypothetical protein